MKNVRTRRRTTLLSAAAAALSIGSIVSAAAPAHAATNPTNCPSGAACLWKEIHYTTRGVTNSWIQVGSKVPILATKNYSGTSDQGHDSVSSMWNAGSWDMLWMYRDENYQGAYWKKNAGNGDSDYSNGSPLDSKGAGVNDAMDSVIYESEK